MENHDKIYKQFKKAARRAEEQPFGRMEAVWNRVEDKLEHKRQREIANYWKYTGIAAILLLFITIGYFMVDVSKPGFKDTDETITVTDTQKVKETFTPKTLPQPQNEVVVQQPQTNRRDNAVAPARQREKALAPVPAATAYEPVAETLSNAGADEMALTVTDDKARAVENTKLQIDNAPLSSPVGNNMNMALSRPAAVSNVVTDTGFYTRNGNKNYNNGEKETADKKQKAAEAYTGVVTSASDGWPMPMVSVTAKGTSEGTITDIDGKFSIEAQKGQVLVFSAIGFETQEVKLADEHNLKIQLRESNQQLEEVVVVGYATTAKRRSNPNNAQGLALQKISQNRKEDSKQDNRVYRNGDTDNANTFDTESDTKYYYVNSGGLGTMEPNSEPLYIINGMEVSSAIIEELEPSYVKSYKIIKEVDAVKLYGGRAVNGAIIIKTKKLSGTKKKEFKELIEEYRLSDKDMYNGAKIAIDREEYSAFEENRFENPANTPLSTFSIDVDNASYTNIRRFLNNGQTVPKDAVRIEEMINFFDYDYPQPKGIHPFSINTEYSSCPWNPQHMLLKIGLKGKEMKKRELPASNFVFLIDVSGSMADSNKLPLLKKNLRVLVNQMRGKDRIAIVVYAGAAEELLPSTSGYERETILAALDKLVADGTTAGGDGIKLAYETAEENFIEDGNNRVILATDGDFNVGPSSDSDMQELIEEKRKSGVFLTCLGYGMGNYKDSKLETLADKGNGNYAYIDTEDEGERFLGTGFNRSMYTIAKDVKIQIEFNPVLVQSYRLIGYENRKLHDEDFENDAIDAGELGSGHTVTALYEIIPAGVNSEYIAASKDLKYSTPGTAAGNYNNELATVKFRYKKPDGAVSIEMTNTIANKGVAIEKASGDFKFAAAVAWFGLKLRDSKLVPDKATQSIIKLAKEGLKNDDEGYRAEFIKLANRLE